MAASGVSMGVHFAAWVWGLYHTSLPHSLLCMSSSPVLLAVGCLLIGKPISAGKPVSESCSCSCSSSSCQKVAWRS